MKKIKKASHKYKHQIPKEKVDLIHVVGTFQKSKNFGFVVPDDRKLGTDVFIPKKYIGKAKNNQKVVVQITKKQDKGKNAEGVIKEILGNRDSVGIDMLSIIKQYDLPYEFPKEVKKEIQNIKETIDEENIKFREDFRNIPIFTIDGEDAKDLDDAISIEKLPNENYVLGVHIADVSYYVREKTALDKEARKRGTSVYMLNQVIPMLPKELSNGICSLNQGVDRFTLSIIMEINKKGKVVKSKVCKGVIKVTRRMSYTNVTKILEESDKEVLEEYKEFIEQFKLMQELAEILKTRRVKNGYLDFNIPESKITFDEKGIPIDVSVYETTIANEIIEHFMLTANEEIAEKFNTLNAPFIYRVHEEPDIDKVRELNDFLVNLGYRINIIKEKVTPKSFEKIIEEVKGKEEERVISTYVLRTLKLARYEDKNLGHFGIASKYYCHFTSPIRRYPDLFIHRVISNYLEKNYNIDDLTRSKYIGQAKEYATLSSEREKIATTVEREAEDIKKAEYMQDKIGEIYEGIISSITEFGIFVELENTIEGMIRFENLGDDYYLYDEKTKVITGENTKETFKIGQKIKIKVIEADKYRGRISFAREF